MINKRRLQTRLAMVHIFAAVLMVACNSSNSFDKKLDMGTYDGHWLSDIEGCIDHLAKNKYVFGRNDLDCTAGTAAIDCSGFVNNVAEAYFPQTYTALVELAQGRPTVGTYYRLTAQAKAGSPLVPVASMSALVAGDLIMWLYKGAERVKLGATGHMMLVIGQAESVGTNQYRIMVADSASSGHDQDTRTRGQSGLGMGYIYFKTGGDGFPIAYSWEDVRSWKTSSPIQLAHFVD
jgi:hypothetical protein